MNTPIHILNQLGVLSSFSVAKKVTEDEVKKYFSKHKRNGKSDKQIGDMLREKIVSEIHEAIQNNQIPGLLTEQDVAAKMGLNATTVARLPELNRLITIVAQKILEKKYDKMSMCYFINSLVNILGLDEDDFEKFHRENNKNDDDDDEPYKDA